MKVRLLRARCFGGERKEAGTVIDLADRHLVREMVFAGMAEEVEKSPPSTGPMTTESATAVVKGKAPRKGANDAGQ